MRNILRAILIVGLILPTLAMAEEQATTSQPQPPSSQPQPSQAPSMPPEYQALLYLKQAAEKREVDATVSSFQLLSQVNALKANPSDAGKAAIAGLQDKVNSLTRQLAETEDNLKIANADKERFMSAADTCVKAPVK